MRRLRQAVLAFVTALTLAGFSPAARAGIPVIDVAALAQLIQQVSYWTQQIEHMVTQIRQLKATYDSISGQRGFGALLGLSNAARNYLPEDIASVLDATNSLSGVYGAASGHVATLLQANAVLSPDAMDALSPEQRQLIDAGRQAAAALQGLSRTAYSQSSQRFSQLQQLLSAISATDDQKAVLELQARIQSEQTMLQNERNKLATLFQAVQAQELTRQQRARELAVQSIGSYRDLPPKSY